MLGVGLSQLVDRYPGLPSTAVDPDGQVHFVQLDEYDPAARELLQTVA